MREFTQSDLETEFAEYVGGLPRFHRATAADDSRLPESWRVVASSNDPVERKAAALSNWNTDFLAQLPRFRDVTQSGLIDVRVIDVPDDEDPWMIYAFEKDTGEWALRTGFSPLSFGDKDPPFFETLPMAVRTFLRTVHAGFVADDGESFGLTPPEGMVTLAEWEGFPEGIPEWEEIFSWEDCCDVIDSRRLLRVTGFADRIDYLASPDLKAGQAIYNFQNDIQIVPFFEGLDGLMSAQLER